MTDSTVQTPLSPSQSMRLAGEGLAQQYLAERDGDGWNLSGIVGGLDAFANAYLSRFIFSSTSLVVRYGERVYDIFARPIEVAENGFASGHSPKQIGLETALACVDSYRAWQSLDQPDLQMSAEMFAGGITLLEQLLTLKGRVYLGIKDGTFAQESPARVFDEVLSPLVTGNLLWLGGEGLMSLAAGPVVEAEVTLLPSSRYPVVYRDGGVIGATFGGRAPSVVSSSVPNPLEAAAYAGETFEAGAAEMVIPPQYFTEGNVVRVALPESANASVSPPTVGGTGALQTMLGLAGGVQIFSGDETSGDLEERARRILRDGLSIVIGNKSLEDFARQFVEEMELAWKMAVMREEARRLREMGWGAQADQIEREMGALSGAFAAKWGQVPSSGPVASAAPARQVGGTASSSRRRRLTGGETPFELAIIEFERLVQKVQDDKIESRPEFLVECWEAYHALTTAIRRSNVPADGRLAMRLMRAMYVLLPLYEAIAKDHYTNGGFDPALAEERLWDMLYERVRSVKRIDAFMDQIAEDSYPLSRDSFNGMPGELSKIGPFIIDVLNQYNETGRFNLKELRAQFGDARGRQLAQAIQCVRTNPEALRDFLVNLLPGIYCANVTKDITGQNNLSHPAATELKFIDPYGYMAFELSDLSPEAFVAQADYIDLLMTAQPELPPGTVTFVNQTTMSVQTHSLDRLNLYLENMEFLTRKGLERLVAERDRLAAKLQTDSKLSAADRERYLFVQKLSEGFFFQDGELTYSETTNGAVTLELPFSTLFRQLYGGYAQYHGTEDIRRETPHSSRILSTGSGMKVFAYRAGEARFQLAKDGGEAEADLSLLVGAGELVVPKNDGPLPWPLGALAPDQKVLEALLRIVGKLPQSEGYRAPSGVQRQRMFSVLRAEDLEDMLPGVAETFVAHGNESVTGKTNPDDIAIVWFDALTEEGRADEADPFVEEMVQALQLAFTWTAITDHRLLALAKECGVITGPSRLFRGVDVLVAETARLKAEYDREAPVWVEFDDPQSNDYQSYLRGLLEIEPALDRAMYHPRDGVTRSREYLPAWAVNMARKHYADLAARGIVIPLKERFVIVIGTERAQAGTYAKEHPLVEGNLIDNPMLPARMAGEQTRQALEVPGENTEEGDEDVLVFPGHGNHGEPMSIPLIAEKLREIEMGYFPDSVHYRGKVVFPKEREDGVVVAGLTDRIPLWQASAGNLVIAAPVGTDGPLLESAWIYDRWREGTSEKYDPESHPDITFSPIRQQIGVRMVGTRIPLSELTVERVRTTIDQLLAGDLLLQRTAYEQGLDPTAGVYIFQPDGRLVQVLQE